MGGLQRRPFPELDKWRTYYRRMTSTLCGVAPGDESQGQNGAKEENSCVACRLSQADLDALMGGSSEEKTASNEEAGTSPVGLSQADLSAAPPAPPPTTLPPRQKVPKAAALRARPPGENPSQDDIDRLLADFARKITRQPERDALLGYTFPGEDEIYTWAYISLYAFGFKTTTLEKRERRSRAMSLNSGLKKTLTTKFPPFLRPSVTTRTTAR